MTILLYLALGLLVGILSGLLGIGGGVLLIPGLALLFGMHHRQAAGITLTILAAPVVLPAAYRYYAAGFITSRDFMVAGWIALGFAVGGYCGAHLTGLISLHTLRFCFGLLLLYMAARFLLAADAHVASAAIGLLTLAGANLAFWGLRLLGQKHGRRPELAEHIRNASTNESKELDYMI